MIRKLTLVLRKLCTAVFVLYGLNLILSSINIIIPINLINVGLVGILGVPGMFALVLMFFIIK